MSGVARAYLGIGSNLGDRLATLQAAVDGIADADGVTVVAVSSVYETDPVGGPEQGAFLNAVVALDTTCSARELLELGQRPRAGGRTASGRSAGGRAPSTSTCCWSVRPRCTSRTSTCRTRGCGSAAS